MTKNTQAQQLSFSKRKEPTTMTINEGMRHIRHEKAPRNQGSIDRDFGAAAIKDNIIVSDTEVHEPRPTVKLTDERFGTEEVTRNGRKFILRNLDEGDLTPREKAAEQRARSLDEQIDERVELIVESGSSFSNLPKGINTAKGVTKAEKQVVRETIDSMVHAIDGESILREREFDRREAMIMDDFGGAPEDEFDENGDLKPLS